MLVLSRKTGESIDIGDSIRITVTSVVNGKVKIGISAPRDVNVRRTELSELSKEERRERSDSKATR